MPFYPTPRYPRPFAALAVLVALLLLLSARPSYAQGVAYADPEFSGVQYAVEPATDCATGCYRLASLVIVPDLGTMVRGQVSGGPAALWVAGWPDGAVTLQSGQDFVFGRGACFTGNGGPHYAHAGTVRAKSDTITALGLPRCDHREFYAVWQWSATGATPTPIGAATWQARTVATWPNCGLTRIMGTLLDAAGEPVAGQRVQVSWDGSPNAHTTSGQFPELGPSGWEFFLNDHPVGHTWAVRLATAAGAPLSPWFSVRTDGQCGDGAVNVVQMEIRGAGGASATATLAPAPPPPPLPTATRPPLSTAPPRASPTSPPPASAVPVSAIVAIGTTPYACSTVLSISGTSATILCERMGP